MGMLGNSVFNLLMGLPTFGHQLVSADSVEDAFLEMCANNASPAEKGEQTDDELKKQQAAALHVKNLLQCTGPWNGELRDVLWSELQVTKWQRETEEDRRKLFSSRIELEMEPEEVEK